MKSTIERVRRGLLVVDKDQIQDLYKLVSEFQNEPKEQEVRDLLNDSPKISVTLRNGETFYPASIDEVFDVPNSARDPIEYIRIKAGMLSRNHAALTIGGSWHSRVSAKIELNGEDQLVRAAEKRFFHIVGKEKDFTEGMLSLRPSIQAIILIIALQALFGLIDINTINFIAPAGVIKIELAWGYLMAFWLIPLFLFSIMFDYGLYRILSRAVFKWGNGEIRYEKRKKILTFIFWSVPLAIALRTITSFWVD